MDRLPYKTRMRNRAIAFTLFILICFGIGSCLFGNKPEIPEEKVVAKVEEEKPLLDVIQTTDTLSQNLSSQEALSSASETPPDTTIQEPEIPTIDSTHILNQKDVFMAKQIDKYLRRFHPDYGFYLIVDTKSNEILAWGERRDSAVQSTPDFLMRNTFPAASLAKTVTLAAALESKRYNLESRIPTQGKSTHLYRSQLRVKEPYNGPTLSLREVYAHSANPSMAIVGYNLGASRLKETAKNLGYNMRFPGVKNAPLQYAPPDTGYALYEVASGFTDEITLSPLVAAAQIRSVIAKKQLELPWAKNLSGYAPDKPYALDVQKFSNATYEGMKKAMIATVLEGSARKRISVKNMARKTVNNLTIGGKTGTLDGKNPAGRYEWFAGFAESKTDPEKSIIIVIMQIYGEYKTQTSAEVAAVLINQWAREYVNK